MTAVARYVLGQERKETMNDDIIDRQNQLIDDILDSLEKQNELISAIVADAEELSKIFSDLAKDISE